MFILANIVECEHLLNTNVVQQVMLDVRSLFSLFIFRKPDSENGPKERMPTGCFKQLSEYGPFQAQYICAVLAIEEAFCSTTPLVVRKLNCKNVRARTISTEKQKRSEQQHCVT